MDLPREGNDMYMSVKDNPDAIAAILAAHRAKYLRLTNPSQFAQITSAAINGQNFSARPDLSHSDRFAIIGWVAKCVELGGPISRMQITTF